MKTFLALISTAILSTACTTVPLGFEKHPHGGVKHILTDAVFPEPLNGHEIKSDSYKYKKTAISVRYTHAGYGGFWIPTLEPRIYTGRRDDELDAKKDIEGFLNKMNASNVTATSYPFKIGDKSVTIWSGKGTVLIEPNTNAVIVSQKSEQIMYWSLVRTKKDPSVFLEMFAECGAKEQIYFDADVKKTFEDYVSANAALF